MKKFIRSQYVSVVAVTAISLSAYYWSSTNLNKTSISHRVLTSSLGNVPYASGMHLNKQIIMRPVSRSISSVSPKHSVEQYAKGDINGDGVISFLDVQYAELVNFGANVSEEKKQKVLSACDVNSDKKCDRKDLELISNKYVAKSGDVNGDGKLSDADFVLAQRIVEMKEEKNTRLSLMKTALNGEPKRHANSHDLKNLEKKLPK